MTIAEALAHAANRLALSGVPNHLRESPSLVGFAIRRERAFLVAHPEYVFTPLEMRRFDDALERRCAREPLQYITGVQEFYGLEFLVTPDVLIPRPETEMLVGHAIEILRETENAMFAEIGIGSGCIAVSILHSLPNVRAAGYDISTGALSVARQNARRHDVAERLHLAESDLYDRFERSDHDLIISNPPYVSAADLDGLQPEVKEFEPIGALTDGDDGLSMIRAIVEKAPNFLRKGGSLVLEIGFGQADAVLNMFDNDLWFETRAKNDFQHIPRMVWSRLR